jgi:nucleotide-binding universal stress UspA family protein
MEKKLLLAIDGSKNSLEALEYAGALLKSCPETTLVLFHVLPPIPPIYKEKGTMDPVSRKYLIQWKKKQQEAVEGVLKKSKERLVKSGWPESQIQVRPQEDRSGVARDILFEAEKGIFDAVVLGRRGMGKIVELFLGSVSTKVIQGAGEIPVWVVGKKCADFKILVAVDGSENSRRAVDHLSFILGSCKDERIEILLLNIRPGFITFSGPLHIPTLPSLRDSKTDYEKKIFPYLDQCGAILQEAGIAPRQIKRKIVMKSADIARSVLSEAQKGGYETIVMGRRGISKAQEFFMGSVSNKVLQQAGDKTIWIVG